MEGATKASQPGEGGAAEELHTEEVETEEIETKEVEEVKVEPEDNAERSRLGRKVSEQSQQIADLATLVKQQQELLEKKNERDPDDIPTWSDIDRYIEERDNKKSTAKIEYAAQFRSAAVDMDTDDPEFHEDVLKLMDSDQKYLKKYSDDGKADAEKNYLRAAIALARGKKNPLKGKAPKGLGVDTGSSIKKENGLPKLDEAAARLAKKLGLSDESIKSALS